MATAHLHITKKTKPMGKGILHFLFLEALPYMALLMPFSTAHLFGQASSIYSVSGVVYSAKSGKPEKGAYVAVYEVREGAPIRYEVPSASHSLFTASDGRFLFQVDGKKAYIMKVAKEGFNPETLEISRKEGVGGKRISIEVNLKIGSGGVLLTEHFVEQEAKTPIEGVQVTMTHLASKTTTACPTDSKGHYYFVVTEMGEYMLSAHKTGYFAYEADTLNLAWGHFDKYSRALPLMRIQIGAWVRMADFDYGVKETQLNHKAMLELDKLYKLLVKHSAIHIEIASHTDARGDAQYNLQVSQERADIAMAYLQAKGIRGARLKAVGYGETKLLNHCADGVRCTAQQHAHNRRMEYAITYIGE